MKINGVTEIFVAFSVDFNTIDVCNFKNSCSKDGRNRKLVCYHFNIISLYKNLVLQCKRLCFPAMKIIPTKLHLLKLSFKWKPEKQKIMSEYKEHFPYLRAFEK